MLALGGEVADGVLLNYLPASHVPWSVEQIRKGGDAEIYGYVHVGVCRREDGAELARRDLFSYAVVDAYARNFERAGFADEVVEVRERHAAGDRDGAVAAICDRMVDAIDVMGDHDHVARHGPVLRRRRRRRPRPHAAAVGSRPPPGHRRHHGRRLGRLTARAVGRVATMQLEGKVVVVTGAARGIGYALAERFLAEGASGVTVVDLDPSDCRAAAERLGPNALEIAADVSDQADLAVVIDRTEAEVGPIDLFASNAGIGVAQGIDASDETWDRIWHVNVMAHVNAARLLVPRMVERGGGYLLITASAAGLLTQIGDAPYSVTKHAAVGARRVAGDHLWRPGHQGLLPVPPGRQHRHADGWRRR